MERIRELTATNSLREEDIKAASDLLERKARLQQPCQRLSRDGTKKTCRIRRSTAKEVGEPRLAELGYFRYDAYQSPHLPNKKSLHPYWLPSSFSTHTFRGLIPTASGLRRQTIFWETCKDVTWKSEQMAQLDPQPPHTQPTSYGLFLFDGMGLGTPRHQYT